MSCGIARIWLICLSASGCAKLNCFIKNLPYWSDPLLLFCLFCPIVFAFNSIINMFLQSQDLPKWEIVEGQRNNLEIFPLVICRCFYDWPEVLQHVCFSPGRLRTKQTLSTASSVGSSQVDSRGRTRSKMASQSQRKYLDTVCSYILRLQWSIRNILDKYYILLLTRILSWCFAHVWHSKHTVLT